MLAYLFPERSAVQYDAEAEAAADSRVAAGVNFRSDVDAGLGRVRDLGLDTNFAPYLPTPLFPSYISGHSTYSAAAAEVLSYLTPAG